MHAPLPHTSDPAVLDAVDRLVAEFGDRFPARLVDSAVRGSRDDLDAVPVTALPELVERLARQRLLDA
ncbi:three-helix bundle dimerization domain-containing protein [Pseudonocardia sp. HH130630-07]|uniref:three-helix bundle dimerization domain-containing protein n=1 Tax=Pseudonocardia sp. HH130630-07 TaxID=1690815 RepID=UPI0008150E5B|nr:hypothetical protein [Pseudonocardia sp. HH130630-07]ANY08484.1 hypothetical protein AFB00_21900 [Pseudonocardia sp. HH130630-07]